MSDQSASSLDPSSLLELTAEIVSAYVGNNTVNSEELSELIQLVHGTLSKFQTDTEPAPKKLKPAVSIKRSVQPDYIVCLDDGRKLKMLKRHLKTAFNMTPEDYRQRWGLPSNYPMVAPNYAKTRSRLAKKIGLGTKKRHARRS